MDLSLLLKKKMLHWWCRQVQEITTLGGSPELTRIQVEPSFDDVFTEFGEGSQEVPLGGTCGLGDQGPMLPTEDAFEGVTLFDPSAVRTAGLVKEEDSTQDLAGSSECRGLDFTRKTGFQPDRLEQSGLLSFQPRKD